MKKRSLVETSQTSVTSGSSAGTSSALILYGTTYGNDAAYLKTSGKMSYGDPGPQIQFSSALSGGQRAALIFTDHDSIGTGVSLSLVSTESDAYFIAPHIKALTGFIGNLSGNASTATKLATARTISLTGSVTGSGTFDGSGNLSIATTTNHTHNYAGSASAGGSANSAVKLDTATAGDSNTPVYFSGGKPVACTSLDLNTSGNAATATKLATARTINGTSFNGSANITTANWGTTRTITIGNTGKSVNGSSNISWTLSEIGAAASGHTHAAATTSANGFMSSDDKAKLDGITASADAVSFSRSLTSGTKVGTITINGTGTDLYAPTNTDTHWTTGITAGETGTTSNSATTNGNTFIKIKDNSTHRGQIKLVGSGATSVSSNAEGVITISSTDNNTTYGSMSVSEGTTGTATTNRVLTAANLKGIINAHAPTKTGGGASGTWGISITGNANSATCLISQGAITAISGTSRYPTGLRLGRIYNSGYPFSYGTTLTIEDGSFGAELIFNGLGRGGATGSGDMRFRTHSDWSTSE